MSAATFSSFSGGTLSIIVLMFLSPVLASWALKFSASESFALATFGLSIIASISGESLIKGLIAGVGGLLIATIGLDPMGGFPRFTGGFVELMNVPFIPVMIGLFAASEAFRSMEQNQQIRQGREGGYRQSVTALANTTPHRINHFALIRIRGFYRHDPRCGGGYCSFCCL